MQRSLKTASLVAAKSVFAATDLLLGPWPGPRLLIYHQIVEHPVREMDLAPAAFSRQVDWLAERGRLVGLDDSLADPEHDDASRDHVLTFDDGYRGLYDHAFPVMLDRGIPFTVYVTSKLVDDGSRSGGEALSWDQVNEMAETGLATIGAHTHTHPDLRDLTTEQVVEEIDVSNELIERRIGVKPRHFAYPKGYWSAIAEPVLRERYETAALGAGPPITRASDPLRLSRIPVQRGDGHLFFKRKVARGMRLEEWTRSRLKGYRNPSV